MAKDNALLWVLAGGAALWYFSKNGLPGATQPATGVPTGNIPLLPPVNTIPLTPVYVDPGQVLPAGSGGTPTPVVPVSTGGMPAPVYFPPVHPILPAGAGGTPTPTPPPVYKPIITAPVAVFNPTPLQQLQINTPGAATAGDNLYQQYLNRDFPGYGGSNATEFNAYPHAAME